MSVSLLALVCAFVFSVQAQDYPGDSSGFNIDPYLQYRPEFARSLPVQILLTGIVLTLVSVLFIHLIFTAQYHYPLAPVNYLLQLSGVTSLLVTLIATLHVILTKTLAESQHWPYMLSYIAVQTPNLDSVSMATRATWSVMIATTSGLIQMTHIQFLTLLYPSVLEARLISCLLVPLSIISVGMQLLLISSSSQIDSIASATRNVCNATLSLLFTGSLFIWGLFINRKQAWRFDGGTAAFGASALALALVSTALNFLYVPREEEYLWLPGLMWAVVLWQSFLGWWWWVGAGSGCLLDGKGPVEELILREEKRERRRRAQFERRKETREKAKKAWRGVTDVFTNNGQQHVQRRGPPSDSGPELSPAPADSRPSTPPPPSSSPTIASSIHSVNTCPRFVPAVLYRWYSTLRHAHQAAAREQTVERVERIREMERDGVLSTAPSGSGRRRIGLVGVIGLGSRRGGDTIVDVLALERRPGSDEEADDGWTVEQERCRSPGEGSFRVGRSIAWWGPLRRWRLQNRTVYS